MQEDVFVIESDGRRRRAIKNSCENCGKDFLCRRGLKRARKYCNTKCSNEGRTKKVSVDCAWCNKKVEKHLSKLRSSRSGLFFCNRICKEEAQKLGGITEIMPSHYGTGKENYRDLFSDKELVCNRCGYHEFVSCVDIHHLDHNRENNDKSNLMPLCSNCHRGLHFGFWKIS